MKRRPISETPRRAPGLILVGTEHATFLGAWKRPGDAGSPAGRFEIRAGGNRPTGALTWWARLPKWAPQP